jgi:DNA-nicking Smr family endonuclease
MGRKRALTDEERELFETALDEAKPLKKAAPRPRKRKGIVETPSPQSPPKLESGPAASLSRRDKGIDGNTAERLRRGLIEPHAKLDLHGLTERDAHRALVTFLRGARGRKFRLVLVVTGKGGPDGSHISEDAAFDLGLEMRRRGVLRAMTPRWLREPDLAEHIVDVREAHRRHGGSGALYVYLRKPSDAK